MVGGHPKPQMCTTIELLNLIFGFHLGFPHALRYLVVLSSSEPYKPKLCIYFQFDCFFSCVFCFNT